MTVILDCLVFTSKHTNKLIEVQALRLKILGAYVPDVQLHFPKHILFC